MAMLLRLCFSRPWQWERGKIPAGSRWQSSLITPLAGWFWRHSGGYGGLHRQAHGERRQQQENDVTTRDGSVAAAMSPRAEVGVRGMGRAGGVRGDEMGIRVGGRTEGQSVWTTEIKGAGTHETEGIAVEGWFQTDDEAVSGGWAYFFFFCAPALDHFIRRLTWEFNLIALLMPFDYIAYVTQSRARNLRALWPGGALDCLPKIKAATENVW